MKTICKFVGTIMLLAILILGVSHAQAQSVYGYPSYYPEYRSVDWDDDDDWHYAGRGFPGSCASYGCGYTEPYYYQQYEPRINWPPWGYGGNYHRGGGWAHGYDYGEYGTCGSASYSPCY